jgi:hypothetical protein
MKYAKVMFALTMTMLPHAQNVPAIEKILLASRQ